MAGLRPRVRVLLRSCVAILATILRIAAIVLASGSASAPAAPRVGHVAAGFDGPPWGKG
jgi:hypothetical protein